MTSRITVAVGLPPVMLGTVAEAMTLTTGFAAAIGEIDGGLFAAEVGELRRRELGQLIRSLDEVRGCLVDVLDPLVDEVAQFIAEPGEFEESVVALSCVGRGCIARLVSCARLRWARR